MSVATGRSDRRRWALGGGLLVVALLVLAASSLAWYPALLLRAGLRLAAHDEIRFDDLRVGLSGLELTGVEIGDPPAHAVAQLRVRYRPQMLLRGRLGEVEVDGLTLRGALDERGLRLSGVDDASAAAGGGASLPPLPLPERISIRGARLELTTPFGPLAVPFAGELRLANERTAFVLDVHGARLAGAAGQLAATLHAEGDAPFGLEQTAFDRDRIAAGLSASGWIDLDAERLSLPGVAQGIDGQGELTLVWKGAELEGTIARLRLEVGQIAPEWAALAAVLPAPWLLEIERPAGISASFLPDQTRMEGQGRVALATAVPQLKVAASAAISLGPDGGLRELVVPDGELELRDLLIGGMRLDRGSIRLDGAGTPASWQGDLELEVAGAGEPRPGLTLDGATARASVGATFADGRLSLLAREPGAARIERLAWTDAVGIDGLELRLDANAEPLLTLDLADRAVVWRQLLAAHVPAFTVRTVAGGTPLHLDAEIERLGIELAGDGAGLDAGRVVLDGGAVRAPAHQLRLSGIAGEIALSADGLTPAQAIPVAIASIVHEGKPAWFAPLHLDGEVRPEADQIGFDIEVAHAAGGAKVRLVGAQDLARGRGRAQVELRPVDFAPGQLQPVALVPFLADLVAEVSGRLAMAGALRWGAGAGIDADLEVLAENLAFTSGPARFAQVNGVIALDRLVPPSTPPGQQLSVGLIDLGLPLTNGLLTFDLEAGRLAVEQLRWQFAQGWIQAAPFTIGSAGMGFSTTLAAEGLSLDEIFALTQLDGLTGEGTMHGTLPITVAGAEAVIAGGELVSDRPGWVRYRPAQAPAALQAGGENVNLLLQALENFRYEQLRLTIDGRTDAEMDVGLHIAGANPDLYDGYPIEFNLNLEGALANVLRSGLAGYQIPERIRERMQGFGR